MPADPVDDQRAASGKAGFTGVYQQRDVQAQFLQRNDFLNDRSADRLSIGEMPTPFLGREKLGSGLIGGSVLGFAEQRLRQRQLSAHP